MNLEQNLLHIYYRVNPIFRPVLVTCYTGFCTGTSEVATLSDCCDHRLDPVGFTYQGDGIQGCFSCPVSTLVATYIHV